MGQLGWDDCRGPPQSLVGCSGVALPLVWAGPSHLRDPDAESFPFWEKDGRRKQIEEERYSVERSRTDNSLIEEASRYGCAPNPSGKGWEEDSWEESDLAKFRVKGWICSVSKRPNSGNDKGAGEKLGHWLRNVEDGLVWMFIEREWMWEEIGAIRGIWDDPWCLGGDFNVILSQRERSNQGRLTSAMRRFAQAWARLDRFLVTQNWLDHFNEVVQSRLPRPTSYHFPILLMGGGLRRGPSLFRFENMWLKADGFTDLLRGWWQGVEVRGRVSVRPVTKMKELKQKIKVWNKEVFGRLEANKNSALQQVEFWDGGGKMTNAHRRNNSLDRIKINGVWMTEDQEVREGIVNAFQHLLLEEPGWRADIEGLHLNRLNSREAEVLEMPFTEEEIYATLMDMNGDKARGSNGFTVAFWQSSWELKEGAEDLGDFWPISFVRELYKLLAKVLANRLKKVLDKVVFGDQNAFVRGKQILDASLIANEWIWWCISTAKFSVMINGVPASFFSNSKGLRQGDPLSLYLFVLGMEVLSNPIRRAVDGGFLSGCRIRGRGEEEMIVSHLLFADDIIIFCEARKEQLSALSWILAWFEASSGL
ncbi:putative mitochondrial protein [Vitis vinifera]|uniref:Putative mitochondrial protein n=1 Tax=Vitis vinifera TaxID=29760 RepID=A0A438GH26_VITVI|nr:putative mitochondrial protein [Vitis vinifera]